MKKCRECQHEISDTPKVCPSCGAPRPTKEKWKDWGFEYKSKTTIMGIPLIHISFKYRPNWIPIPAKGIISIGQFGIGVINISQFGIGILSLSQITIAFYALAQVAIAYSLIAQVGLYVNYGYGKSVWDINEVSVSCTSDPTSQYIYKIPENIDDGLEVGSLDEVNIDPALIEKAVNKIRCGKYKEVHSMLIFKDNKLVFEEYFKGHKYKWDAPKHHGELVTWDRDILHSIMSDTKSITSACIGIAIDKGLIKSVHQSIFDYLPEHQHLNTDGKDKITTEHLLTMTSGLEGDEWSAPYSSSDNPATGIWFTYKDPITYILERPLIDEPGTSFSYFGGNMIVLGEIIKNAAKMTIEEFSGKYLFEPLGIDSFNWSLKFENGVIETAGGLKITPRAMVKIGATFLNKGVWNGKQIISKQWVEKSATSFPGNNGINIPGEDSGRVGYSYSWWTKQYSNSGKRINMFYAGGWGGQHIMVLPELNTVVVFTGGNYLTKRPPFKILKKYVIPAFN
jgi:CubicO group peptidase (beta-lactamase class C family)